MIKALENFEFVWMNDRALFRNTMWSRKMSQKVNVQGYYEYMKMPWGKLFYELSWNNIECQGKRVLDFGSGFGYTADHFAKSNEVIAVEPNEEMIENRFLENDYQQIKGDIGVLKKMPDGSFDVIIWG